MVLRNYLAIVTVLGPVPCVFISQVQISILTIAETWGEFLLIEHLPGIGVMEVIHLTKVKPVMCGHLLSCPECQQHHYLRAGILDNLTSEQETCPAGRLRSHISQKLLSWGSKRIAFEGTDMYLLARDILHRMVSTLQKTGYTLS